VAAEGMKLNYALWFSRGLATLSAGWCVVVGCWIWFTPIPVTRGVLAPAVYTSFSAMSLFGPVPLLVPAAIALLGAWAAWRGHGVVLGAVAALLLLFSYIAGFSIGAGYMPAAGGMVLATAALASVERTTKPNATPKESQSSAGRARTF
jgi:hypothetical protein